MYVEKRASTSTITPPNGHSRKAARRGNMLKNDSTHACLVYTSSSLGENLTAKTTPSPTLRYRHKCCPAWHTGATRMPPRRRVQRTECCLCHSTWRLVASPNLPLRLTWSLVGDPKERLQKSPSLRLSLRPVNVGDARSIV